MIGYFCPSCYDRIDRLDTICPSCGVAIEEWVNEHSFAERLVRGLHHPLPSTRMMAIISLGNRGEPWVSVPLAHCALSFPVDTPQSLEVVRTLEKLPDSEERAEALDILLYRHPSRPVRRRVAEVLGVDFRDSERSREHAV